MNLDKALIQIAGFQGRDWLGPFFERSGYRTGAEIGTHRGDFAAILLERWPGTLYCVDPWSVPPGYEPQVGTLWGGAATREDDFTAARARLSIYRNRVRYIRDVSESAAKRFEDASLDFVYIDGDHRREMVALDIETWWPKVSKGGAISGHDIICPGEVGRSWADEIQPVVLDFAERHKLTVYLIPEVGMPWSFYIIKE